MLLNCGAKELLIKEIKLVNSKENQPFIVIGRTNAETEAPILGPPNAKSWLIGKDHDSEKDWWQKEMKAAEDELVRKHHWLKEQTLGVVNNKGSWYVATYGVPKSWMWLDDWIITIQSFSSKKHIFILCLLHISYCAKQNIQGTFSVRENFNKETEDFDLYICNAKREGI